LLLGVSFFAVDLTQMILVCVLWLLDRSWKRLARWVFTSGGLGLVLSGCGEMSILL
jgi:hypothetical protein